MLDKLVTRRFARRSFLAGLGASAALPILAACQPQIVEKVVEKPVDRVVTQVVERVVEKEVERVVTQVIEIEKIVQVEKPVEIVKETVVERIVEVPATGPEMVEVTLSHWVGQLPDAGTQHRGR